MALLVLSAVFFAACSDDKSTSSNDQPHGLKFVGQYNTPGYAAGVIVEGQYAYVADHDSGMQIINVSNPAQPVLAGHYQCPGALQIDVRNGLAYIADEVAYSMEIVDVSNPGNPTFVGRFDTLEVLGVKVAGNYAFMGCGSHGLQVVDIADPANPSLAGSCEDVELLRFELIGNHAVVPGDNGTEGLFTVDLSNPMSPCVGGSIPTGGNPFEVAVKDSFAYMTNLGDLFNVSDTGHLYLINISDMASPQMVDSLFLANKTVADFIAGNYLYVTFVNSGTTSGFHIIDISDPMDLEIVATQSINSVAWDIWVANNTIYIAANEAGLMIYRFYP
jgi:hypothetical protein